MWREKKESFEETVTKFAKMSISKTKKIKLSHF